MRLLGIRNDMTETRNLHDDDMPLDETLEGSLHNRRVIEDIGGNGNLELFYKLQIRFNQSKETLTEEFETFRMLVSETLFNYGYCLRNSYLFEEYLKRCPKYIDSEWFVKDFTRMRMKNPKVDILHVMYVKRNLLLSTMTCSNYIQ